ncbi:MAG: hypothetical protein HY094_07760 [Candidatus Melainabacteria bacterium]|nr:hypothetical protein [Candidatus Melainabacteria bacterium]
MKNKFLLLLLFLFTANISFAKEPRIINYDGKNKTIKVEIDGKEYTLDVPIETPSDISKQDEQDSTLSGSAVKKKKQYAKGPASTTVGSRLFTVPTDTLLPKKGFGFDFTHRFSEPIKSSTNYDVYGLDGFAYTGIGLYYGITNNLEAHVFRTSLTDASEFGLKFQVFKEARKFGTGAPFGLTLSSGFQNDDIQNSIDPYVQAIVSKVIIPSWLKVYVVPTYAWRTPTIGSIGSKSAVLFSFNDPKHRGFIRNEGTFGLPIGAALQIIPNKLSLFGEYTPVLSGFRESKNAWAFGLQILSRLETHVWTIGVSNTPYSTFGQFIVGAPSNNLHFGFNITARIK